MLQLFVRSIQDFRRTFKKHLLFEYLFMLLTSFVFIPLMSYIFNRIIRTLGSGSMLNGEVFKIGLSYTGILGLIAICMVAVIVLFIEFGVVITIAQKNYFGTDVLISDAVLTTLRKTPRLFGLGVIPLLFFLFMLIPFIESPISLTFFSQINVPIFFNNQLHNTSYFVLSLYFLVFLAAAYTFLRWIFVMHYIFIEGKSVFAAIKSSMALTRGRPVSLFIYLFLLNGIVLTVGFLILSAIAYFPSWMNINVLKAFTNHYSLTLSTVLTYMLTLLLVPVNIIFLTRVFYNFNRSRGVLPRDGLRIYRSRWIGHLESSLYSFLSRKTKKRVLYVSILAIYLSLMLLVSQLANDNLVYMKWNVLLSAHRGITYDAPENSLRAVQAAIDEGVDAVEIDVQLTKDGMVVLHHDLSLQRMTGLSKRVSDLTYEQLLEVDLGKQTGVSQEVDHIPLLSEVLAEAQGKTKLIVDLKPYGPGKVLANKVVELIEQFEMIDDSYIQSFDRQTLQQIRERNPDIKIGQILYFAVGDLSLLDVDFYTIEKAMLTEQLVERAHRNGREVWVWTVNSEWNLKEVLKFEVDGIITDYPTRAQNMVELNL